MFVFNAIASPTLDYRFVALNTADFSIVLYTNHITRKYLMQYSGKNWEDPVKTGKNLLFLEKKQRLRVKITHLCGLYAYKTEEDLQKQIDELHREMFSEADLRNCFIEADFYDKINDRSF